MGLLTGGLNFRRFRIHQPLPEGFREHFLESIPKHAFEEDLGHRSKEPLIGWVNVFNAGDTRFDLNTFLFDHYLVLSMRMDKKAVNGRLFQILLQRRLDEIRAERGIERIGKKHKEEIKEALEEELLGRALPSVATHDLAWDVTTGEVLAFATSDTVADLLQGLFHDTFGVRMYPERMVDWLSDRWDWPAIIERADRHLPGGAAQRSTEVNEDGRHEGNPLEGRELQLGSDFLIWLWHESERLDGVFRLADAEGADAAGSGSDGSASSESAGADDARPAFASVDEDLSGPDDGPDEPVRGEGGALGRGEGAPESVVLWFDNKLILRDIDDVEAPGMTTMVGESPASSPEARLTVSTGKRPVEARLGMMHGEMEWLFTLRAGPGGVEVSGLKMPIEVKDGEDEKIYERMFLLEMVHNTLRRLFQNFFAVRTSDAWPAFLDEWIGRQEA